MRFVLIDDHPIFRMGLAAGLARIFGDESEVTEAGSFAEAMRMVPRLREADLILCDLTMQESDPSSALPDLMRAAAPTPVVVVSASEDPANVRMAMATGVRGYIVKRKTLRVLKSAVELVLEGDTYLPSELLAEPEAPVRFQSLRRTDALSSRQEEILGLVAEGLSNKEIGNKLDIVEGTVKVQLKAIYRKLGVANRTQAALHVRDRADTGTALTL